jgi:hypothetical protein
VRYEPEHAGVDQKDVDRRDKFREWNSAWADQFGQTPLLERAKEG